MHRQMADMMKAVSKGKGGLGRLFGMGGGMPEMTPEMLEAAKSGKLPGLPGGGLPGGMTGMPGGLGRLPGMPGGFTGLPGLPGKKK
jgi:signal recognition particle subunit SRP54